MCPNTDIRIHTHNTTTAADVELSRVISFEKRQALYNILHSEDPDHYSRLWLVGFLKFCGYSADEICAVIHAEGCWADYDARTTFCQVNSVFRTSGRTATANKQCTTSGNKVVDRKKHFLSKCVADPCSDSIDGFCYLASGNYNIPSADEKTRRALNCFYGPPDSEVPAAAGTDEQEQETESIRTAYFRAAAHVKAVAVKK